MAMTQIPRDFLELLKLLNQHGVKHLVIGGYAVVLHGHNRMTGDLDLFIELCPPRMPKRSVPPTTNSVWDAAKSPLQTFWKKEK